MKPTIIAVECLTAGAALSWFINDPFWLTTTGFFVLALVLAVVIGLAWTYGRHCGIQETQSNHDLLFRTGFQTGVHWKKRANR